jgi:hypothetical protein
MYKVTVCGVCGKYVSHYQPFSSTSCNVQKQFTYKEILNFARLNENNNSHGFSIAVNCPAPAVGTELALSP